MEEIWKDVKGYEGIYQVSDLGRIKRLTSLDSIGRRKITRIMAVHVHNGYVKIRLSKNSIRKNYSVHRLVAKAFIANLDAKGEVNHIDGNKTNTQVSNLEWMTSSENQLHAYRTGLDKSTTKRRNDYRSKPVIQILNNKIINAFLSVREAQRQTGFCHGTISSCCRGDQRIAYGFVWRYS